MPAPNIFSFLVNIVFPKLHRILEKLCVGGTQTALSNEKPVTKTMRNSFLYYHKA